jgi:hypothetical protein
MNTQKRLRPIMRNCLVVIVTTLCLAACSGPSVYVPIPAQVAERVTDKDVLQTCAVLRDQDMAEIRGCYDSIYAFGLDFVGTIDFTNSVKRIEGRASAYAIAFNADPLKKNQNFTNGQVTAPAGGGLSIEAGNSDVAFHSSVGESRLGTGVIQLVQVMGNNNLVFASTNVTININGMTPIKSTVSGPGGLNFLRR